MAKRHFRRVLVTGSNRGLGLEFVRQLAERAEVLFATCRDPEEAEALSELSEQYGDTVEIVRLDVADPACIARAADRVAASTGSLDLLVNNAGISGGGSRDDFEAVDQETLLQTFRVNAAGPHLLVQELTGLLQNGTREEPSIVVNITSGYGSISNASGGGWHSYKASKAALNMLSRIQAAEVQSDGVIVVAMNPGWVRTDMGGSQARLSPDESVAGVLEVIGDLTLEDSGRFLDYQGRERAW